MNLREKLTRRNHLPFHLWHKKLWRSFWILVGGLTLAWIAAGLFTVWLLRE